MQYEDYIDEPDDAKFEEMLLELREARELEKVRKAEWEAEAPERQRIHDEKMLNDPHYAMMHEVTQDCLRKVAESMLVTLSVFTDIHDFGETITIKKPER